MKAAAMEENGARIFPLTHTCRPPLRVVISVSSPFQRFCFVWFGLVWFFNFAVVDSILNGP